MIRTGILCVPHNDDEIITVIRSLLREVSPNFYIVQDEGIGDQRNWLEEVLRRWSDEDELDLILTIGGTMPAPGPAVKESVPEATASMIERPMPGLADVMRRAAAQETPLAYLDRGVVGIRGRTLIVNLPAGAAPAYLFLESLVELLEPTILHLQEKADAPTLTDVLQIEDTDETAATEKSSALPEKTTANPVKPMHEVKKELDPTEFAAFLKRTATPPDQKK